MNPGPTAGPPGRYGARLSGRSAEWLATVPGSSADGSVKSGQLASSADGSVRSGQLASSAGLPTAGSSGAAERELDWALPAALAEPSPDAATPELGGELAAELAGPESEPAGSPSAELPSGSEELPTGPPLADRGCGLTRLSTPSTSVPFPDTRLSPDDGFWSTGTLPSSAASVVRRPKPPERCALRLAAIRLSPCGSPGDRSEPRHPPGTLHGDTDRSHDLSVSPDTRQT